MGQEFWDAIGTDEWDVLENTITEGGVRRLGLFHLHHGAPHPTQTDPRRLLFWVADDDQKCRVCEKKAPDFVWFRYKTWKLRNLTA